MTEVPKWSSKQFLPFKSNLKNIMKLTGKTIEDLQEDVNLTIRKMPSKTLFEIKSLIMVAAEWEAERYYSIHDVEHIFMPGGDFFNWLSTIEKPDFTTGTKELIFLLSFFSSAKVLLFPIDSGIKSVLVYALQSYPKDDSGNFTPVPVIVCTNGYPEGDVFTFQIIDNKIHVTEDSRRFLSFLVGFAIYYNAFPNDIKDGIPPWVSDQKQYKNKKTLFIGVSKEVCEPGNTVSPHFRKGHFRMLSSDRYKNKKGQWVFVSGCFVKGHASTVDLDNIDSGDT
jgi:hypothetical protein